MRTSKWPKKNQSSNSNLTLMPLYLWLSHVRIKMDSDIMTTPDITNIASGKFTDWGKLLNTCNRVATKKVLNKNFKENWFHQKTQKAEKNSSRSWYSRWKANGLLVWIWKRQLVFKMVKVIKKNLKLASMRNNPNSRKRTPTLTGALQDLEFTQRRDSKEFLLLENSY